MRDSGEVRRGEGEWVFILIVVERRKELEKNDDDGDDQVAERGQAGVMIHIKIVW